MSRCVAAVANLSLQCGLSVQCNWPCLYPRVILQSCNASHCAWCDGYNAAEAWQHDILLQKHGSMMGDLLVIAMYQ